MEMLSSHMEWVMLHGRCYPEGTSDYPHLRCLWQLGMWCIHLHWGLVPASISGDWSDVHITAKELLPIVLGVAVWGPRWKGRTVLCRCDNAAVVAIVNLGRSRIDRAMHLMRCLSFLARWEVSLICRHIPGVENGAADALSRDDLQSFQRLVPEAAREPCSLLSSCCSVW